MTIHVGDISVKFIHKSVAMITNVSPNILMHDLNSKVREIYHFSEDQPVTLKWIDEEEDPCVLSSDMEIKEAVRLYFVNRECQLTVLVYGGVPAVPGKPCPGEDLINRRGAKRWKQKFYVLQGHKFAARRFTKTTQCIYCNGRIWGLGQPGLKCLNCRLLLHRRCQGCVQHRCGDPVILPGSRPISATQPWIIRMEPRPSSPALSEQLTGNGVPTSQLRPMLNDYSTQKARTEPPTLDTITNVRDSIISNSSIGHGDLSARKEILVNGQRILSPMFAPNTTPVPEIPSGGGAVGLQDFKLLKVIGRGSFAKVFQVEHIATGRVYAMKVIKKETIQDEEDIEWVQTEKHVFECATNYPFLVGLHSCFQTDSRLFLVIEFVTGGDMMYYMQRNLRLPDDFARFYAAEISAALNYLHEHGIIYRDLKLDNVLMDHEGHIKLTDYGMCKEGMIGDAVTNTFCGTPSYLAPEILRNEPYNCSVDWWALGVLLFEFLAGRSPWDPVGQSMNPDQNTESYLMRVILEHPIRIPRMITVQSTSMLRALLVKDPRERLGCPPRSSFAEVMNHPFFKTIDWVALEQKQVPPPYRPSVNDVYDMTHFDPTFTDEPVVFTPGNEEIIASIDQSEFEGFEYVNPLLMSLDVAV